ncbi:MAG TPA: hypothetical protein PLI11_05765 [Clostridia bacterium]|jgi:hypothetical protein|nr:hypothetical protein [Clostridia bacterium]
MLKIDPDKYEEMPPSKVEFQYPSAFIDNDILYVLLRTAFNHAFNYHDANYITFHKYLKNIKGKAAWQAINAIPCRLFQD